MQWARHRAPGDLVAAEMGTGCGAIALALAALEPRFTRIYAVDVSPSVLEAARANGARYLLESRHRLAGRRRTRRIPEPVDLIVCGNLVWGTTSIRLRGRRSSVRAAR